MQLPTISKQEIQKKGHVLYRSEFNNRKTYLFISDFQSFRSKIKKREVSCQKH